MRSLKAYIFASLLIIPVFLVSGCLEVTDTDRSLEDFKKGQDMANDIWISIQVRWKVPPAQDTYALFPTLVTEDGEVLQPLFGDSDFSRNGFPVSERNFSVVNTVHGPCLRWNISVDDIKWTDRWENGVIQFFGVVDALVPFVSDGDRIYYNRSDFSGLEERFLDHSPGLSAWDEESGSVYTWSYVDSEAYSLGFTLSRADVCWGIVFGHDRTIYDSFKDPDYEEKIKLSTCVEVDDTYIIDAPGWHKIQIERYADNWTGID